MAQPQLGERGQRRHRRQLRGVLAEEHGVAAGCDGFVYAAGVAVDAELAHIGPAVDGLDLFLGLVRRLVGVQPGEDVDLRQQRRAQAHAGTGVAAEAHARRGWWTRSV